MTLTFCVILCFAAAVLVVRNNRADIAGDVIYNYLDYGENRRITVNLDDYIAGAVGLGKIIIYDKKTKTVSTLGDTVFDYKKQFCSLMFSVGNKLYYETKDSTTNTNTVYEFDLDSYEKKAVFSQSEMTDPDGFLSVNELFGISNTYLLDFSRSGSFIVRDKKLVYLKDIYETLQKKDFENKFSVPTENIRLCANKNGVYFINDFDELIFYSFEKDSMERVLKNRIKDFFITDEGLYYSKFSVIGELFFSPFDKNDETAIGKADLKDVRVEKGKSICIFDGYSFWKLENKKLSRLLYAEDSNATWEFDGKSIWFYNPGNETFNMNK